MATKVYETTTDSVNSGLAKGWLKVRFDEIAENIVDHVEVPSESGYERFVGGDHLDSDSLKISRWGSTSDVEAQKLLFKKGHILFGKRNAYLRKVAYADFDGVCSAHMLVLKAKPEYVLEDFLPFFMQTDQFWERALMISEGSMSPTIKWKTLAQQEFALPPKDEQRRIADILWAIEKSSEQFNRCVDKAEQLRRIILSEIILKGINHTEFQNTEIGLIPASWNITQIRNVGNVQLGRQRAPQYQTGIYSRPYLRVANVFDGYLDLTDVLKMDFDSHDYEKYVLKNGDILINEGQSRELVGRSCIYRGEIEGCCFQNTLIRFQVSDKLLPEFAFGYFQNALYQEQFAQMARQTTSIAHLGADRFANFLIPVPPIEEQQRIIEYLEVQNQECNHLRNHLNGVVTVKSRLLHHMLSNC